jgi:hypothetical protein
MPIDRGTLDAQLRDIGEGDRWWEVREFRELPHILHADERIRGVATGRLVGGWRPRLRPTRGWLLIATDLRVICLKQERVSRRQVDIVPAERMYVRTSSRMRGFEVAVIGPQVRYRLRVARVDASRFVSAVEALFPRPAARIEDSIPGAGMIEGARRLLSAPSGPPPPLATAEELHQVELMIDRMAAEMDGLRERIVFLEELLQQRADDTLAQR